MIIKIAPDKEKARSIFNLTKNRREFISSIDIKRFPTNAAENYYEIIKELGIGILLLDGLKATGDSAHKEMIEALAGYDKIEGWEIELMDDLRVKRNRSSYEGKEIEYVYLKNKRDELESIINKLEKLLDERLK